MFRSLPEELLARILAFAFARTTLLVSRQFFRIAAPLLYHTVHLHSQRHASRALTTLARHPALASAVRRLAFAVISHDAAAVLALCNHVQDIDISLDAGSFLDVEAFCDALERRHTIAHLTLRKGTAVYLTHPRPVRVLQRLAQAVHRWTSLETVHFAFRISASPSTLSLARALSTAPRLRTVRAQVPAVWNTLLLVISTNPGLEKVVLYGDGIDHAVLGTGLYMTEARKHARLSELIKSGTSVVRSTTIATLGAVRAKDELTTSRVLAGHVT